MLKVAAGFRLSLGGEGGPERDPSMPDTVLTEPDFRALFEKGPGLYLVLDPELIIVGVSDAYCRATMTERDAIIGKGLFEVFPDNPDDIGATGEANLRASLDRVLKFRKPDAMAVQKYDIQRPDSEGGGFEERYWSPLNTPVLDSAGNVAWILHRVQDVTELIRLQSEEAGSSVLAREQQMVIDQLRFANRELAETIDENLRLQRDRLHLASVVEWSDDAIVTKTLDGIVTSWNRSAERIFGYAAWEMLGRPITVLIPDDLAEEEVQILERLRTGEAIDHYVTRRVRKDGKEIYVSLTVSPIRDAAGDVVGASKIARDVTERRKAEARLEDLQSELIHLSRWNMMGMMAATIAHELNQPLAAIANYAAALKRMLVNPQPPGPMAADILEKIVKQRHRASQIVERLRNQVARGGGDRRPETLDDVVAEALELAASTIQKAGVRLSYEATTPLKPVLIDRVQIQQVVINLVRNAVEAMERSRVKSLQVSVKNGTDGVHVNIADSGSGLPDDVATRLFQPFVTTKSSGMGLGLSICKDIIETHGGRLWAQPNEPHGTVFSFVLPVYSGDAPA